MIPPNAAIDKLSFCVIVTWFAHARLRKHAMASVQPTIGPPDETVQRLVPIVDPPTIEQYLGRTVWLVVTIGIGNKGQMGWRADKDATKSTGQPRCESQLVSKGLLLVEDTVAIGVLQDLNPADLIVGVLATRLIVEILGNPHPSSVVKTKGDGFGNVRLGSEYRDFESVGNRHFCDRFVGFQKRRIAALMLFFGKLVS